MDLSECGTCGRKFNPDALTRHRPICAKNQKKKPRKAFDAQKNRLLGTEVNYNEIKRKEKMREKEKENFQVCASVQMWTLPGQMEILKDRENVLTEYAENKENLTAEEIKTMSSKIPAVKSIAIFRAEGGDQTKYLFPGIYMDILKGLPADIICREYVDDEEKEDISM